MDEHLDTSWCPGCDRLVPPQRVLVPVNEPSTSKPQLQQPQLANAPPPQHTARSAQRGKRVARGGALGLVHGTGRVKPGGGIRRTDSDDSDASKRTAPTTSTNNMSELPPAPPPPSPSSPRSSSLFHVKVRSVISSQQTPLYCSEECRISDTQRRQQVATPFFLKAAPVPASISPSCASSDGMFPVPPHRRPSDSSNDTDFSSLFDRSPPKVLPDLEEDEIPATPPSDDLSRVSTSQKIMDALGPKPESQKDKSSSSRSENPVPPGWRNHETAWRKIVYGHFPLPSTRPAMIRKPSTPTVHVEPPPTPIDVCKLSPFDRVVEAPSPRNANLDLLAKLTFVRTPSSTNLSAGSHSRTSGSSASSAPPLSLCRTDSGTRSTSSYRDDDDFSDDEACVEPPFYSTRSSMTHVPSSFGRFSSSNDSHSNPLARAVEAKRKEERLRVAELKRVEKVEQEIELSRKLRAQVEEPQSLREHVMRDGPIMGRRAAGLSSAPTSHSWSYESLPPHIPLYKIPGLKSPRKVKRVERVQDKRTGCWKDVEVDVIESPKRLFNFGTSESSRRHSSLSISSASQY